jgi:uncharacterized protein (TIGR03086 family)
MSAQNPAAAPGLALSEQRVFVLSEHALAGVIDQVPDSRWGETTPAWFATNRAGALTLREIVNYHAYDSAWVPDVLAGRTIAEVGDRYDGDLLGDDPRGGYRRHSDRAVAAAEALDDPGRTVHLSYGDFPAREYLKHVSSFRCFRAYDIARWMGLPTDLPPALVQGMWDHLLPQIDEWRRMGVFGPPVEVPAGAPLQDRLLGLVGRDPGRR